MNFGETIRRMLTRSPLVAATAYVAVFIVFVAVGWSELANLKQRHDEVSAANDILARLQGHAPAAHNTVLPVEVIRSGSPFLEGATVTIAGAALLRRVSETVAKVEGNIQSSQVDLQGTQLKNGFIDVIVTCEVDQPALQRLLYDLEAGMPFLFVDQMVAQAPVESSIGKEGRMRVLLAVSGQWQGAR